MSSCAVGFNRWAPVRQGHKSVRQNNSIRQGVQLDGISSCCPIWVHKSASTNTRNGNPFITGDVAKESSMPIFWGVAFGWELATGYPWGFWQSGRSEEHTSELQPRFGTA